LLPATRNDGESSLGLARKGNTLAAIALFLKAVFTFFLSQREPGLTAM
jgi:hypothetical protein